MYVYEGSAALHPDYAQGSETALAAVSKFLQRKNPQFHHDSTLQENLGY